MTTSFLASSLVVYYYVFHSAMFFAVSTLYIVGEQAIGLHFFGFLVSSFMGSNIILSCSILPPLSSFFRAQILKKYEENMKEYEGDMKKYGENRKENEGRRHEET